MKKKSLLTLVLAVAAACACALPGRAAQAPAQYAETVITLPVAEFSGRIIKSLSVDAGGALDLYTSGDDRKAGGDPHYLLRHDRSQDGGKTWKTVDDVKWAAEYDQYGGESLRDLLVDKAGNVYAYVDKGGDYELFKGVNGVMKRIASGSAQKGSLHAAGLSGITDAGEPVICWLDWTNNKFAVTILDASGNTRAEYPLSFVPTIYAAGRAFGDDWKETGGKINQACDIVTQVPGAADAPRRLPLDLALDKDPDTMGVGWGVLTDGTIFYTSRNGLYRCLPGESWFTKVLNGEACYLGSEKLVHPALWCNNAAADGSIYMTGLSSGGKITILRYTPVGGD